ncbi:MAG: DUF2225 domain-containing protein [bacterium]|nr:DUF2225 domain-containing protein [bacterium]MDT8396356.1 DUF2225 domain-containing protein [bacterium]
MTTVKSVTFTCPCCGQDFTSHYCPTTNSLGPTTTDFFDMAAGEQPIHYKVHTCTHCGFSCEEMEKGELSRQVKKFVRDNITPKLTGDEIPSWTKFEFLALIDENVGSDPYSLGMIYLHAAWCAYDQKQTEAEARFRKKAIRYLEKAFTPETLDRDLLYLIPYLVAEQYRRTGEEESALQWYGYIIAMEEEHPDKVFFVSMAVQQSTDPKELMGEVMYQ